MSRYVENRIVTFFFSSRRRHTRWTGDWSSDVCSSDLLPGFGGASYIDYLAPGVLVMNTLFSNGWSGTAYIVDMERGVLDRFLVAPARRSSFLIGQLAYWAVLTTIQSIILIGIAVLV